MDLTKLFQPKNQAPHSGSSEDQELKKIFLTYLCDQINKDLKFILSQNDSENFEFLKNCRCSFGSMQEEKEPIKKTNSLKYYTFLSLPEKPGLLLESSIEPGLVALTKASRVMPLFTDDFGNKKLEEIFIIRSKPLHTIKIIDKDCARVDDNRIFNLEQISEMLIILSYDIHLA
ncbi:MAG: hypothetical protein K2X39_04675 [Silvanigrellaceae bacterium]|nr:hypothetical protein [Silvanigrellaceae bacterium]